jgi:MFS transporter, AAHS family, 4-hydroxybenzoate transporter
LDAVMRRTKDVVYKRDNMSAGEMLSNIAMPIEQSVPVRSQAAVGDLNALWNRQPVSIRQIIVFVICFLVTGIEGFDTTIMAFIAPKITRAWTLAPSMAAPLIVAGMVGLLIGSIAGGLSADRYGRKVVVLVALVEFGAISIASAYATSLSELIVLRLMTGLGIGAAMPVVATFVAEFSSDKSRPTVLAATYCGFLMGGTGAGMLTAALSDRLGWEGMLVISGIMPLGLFPLFLLLVPESPRHMLMRRQPIKKIRRVMKVIFPKAELGDAVWAPPPDEQSRPLLLDVFRADLRVGTLLIWLAAFAGYLVFFLLGGWLPSHLRMVGMTISVAAGVSSLLQLGALAGSLCYAWMLRKANAANVVAIAFALAAALTAFLLVDEFNPLYRAIVFALGFTIGGPLICINTIAALFYPTALRASGAGCAFATGRLGSIVGSICIGLIFNFGWQVQTIFIAIALMLLLGTFAMTKLSKTLVVR